MRLKRRELLAQKISLLAGQEHHFVFLKSHELRVLVIFNALLKLKTRQPGYDSDDSMFTSAELCRPKRIAASCARNIQRMEHDIPPSSRLTSD